MKTANYLARVTTLFAGEENASYLRDKHCRAGVATDVGCSLRAAWDDHRQESAVLSVRDCPSTKEIR